ncbi:MAG: FG-GAP-like repeat-containing protein, partial [Microthrixaceae bacterium]
DVQTTTFERSDPARPEDVTATVDAEGKRSTAVYDPTYGTVTQAVDPVGNRTATTYDLLGRPVTVQSPRGTAAGPTISTLAGTGAATQSGDGGPAVEAGFAEPQAVALDQAGNTYVSDFAAHTVRRIAADGTITTVAGAANTPGNTGDGGQASAARLSFPRDLLVADGFLYVSDSGNHRVRRINLATGVIANFAGDPTGTRAGADEPMGVSTTDFQPVSGDWDGDGRSDVGVRQISNGTFRLWSGRGWNLTSVPWVQAPGTDYEPFSGDWNGDGRDDIGIRRISDGRFYFRTGPTWSQSEVGWGTGAGTGHQPFTGDWNGDGKDDFGLRSVASGQFFFAPGPAWPGARANAQDALAAAGDASWTPLRTLRWDLAPTSLYQPTAGDWDGDGKSDIGLRNTSTGAFFFRSGPSYTATRNPGDPGVSPGWTALQYLDWNLGPGAANKPLIGDWDGSGEDDFGLFDPTVPRFLFRTGPSWTATRATVNDPGVEPGWNAPTGLLWSDLRGFIGDGGQATAARLHDPTALAMVDGTLFIAEFSGHRVRAVSPAGVISTVAGNGTAATSGDGGAASAAKLNAPVALAVDGSNRLVVVEYGGHRVRRIEGTTPGSLISTIAGTGTAGYSGDFGPATAARLNLPVGVVATSIGVLFTDNDGAVVRRIADDGTITTVVGTGANGFGGDGGPASTARLDRARRMTVTATGDLLIADKFNHRVRKVTGLLNPPAANAFTTVTSYDAGGLVTSVT